MGKKTEEAEEAIRWQNETDEQRRWTKDAYCVDAIKGGTGRVYNVVTTVCNKDDGPSRDLANYGFGIQVKKMFLPLETNFSVPGPNVVIVSRGRTPGRCIEAIGFADAENPDRGNYDGKHDGDGKDDEE